VSSTPSSLASASPLARSCIKRSQGTKYVYSHRGEDVLTIHQVFGPDDYTCSQTHSGAPWYQQTPSGYWCMLQCSYRPSCADPYLGFLCAPAYSFFLSLRNQQPLMAKELVSDTKREDVRSCLISFYSPSWSSSPARDGRVITSPPSPSRDDQTLPVLSEASSWEPSGISMDGSPMWAPRYRSSCWR